MSVPSSFLWLFVWRTQIMSLHKVESGTLCAEDVPHKVLSIVHSQHSTFARLFRGRHCLRRGGREIIPTHFRRIHLSLTNEGVQPEKSSILIVFSAVSVPLKIHQESLALLAGTLNLLRGKNGKLFISYVLRSEAGPFRRLLWQKSDMPSCRWMSLLEIFLQLSVSHHIKKTEDDMLSRSL